MLTLIFFLIFAYLCGSINSAVLVCKFLGLPDPRSSGSNNPGTTNVLRIGGKKAAAAVLFLDGFKGFFPVVLAKIFLASPWMIGLITLAAIVGHMYPIFFKFQGGKGVATLIGSLLAIQWSVGLIFIVIWLAMAKLFRYSSLAALTATAIMPFTAWYFYDIGSFVPLLLVAAIIFYRHQSNIKRLRNRTEPKIGEK